MGMDSKYNTMKLVFFPHFFTDISSTHHWIPQYLFARDIKMYTGLPSHSQTLILFTPAYEKSTVDCM